MKLSYAVFAVALLVPVAAFAGPASDAVKFFYSPVGSETDPATRDRYADPAKTKLDQNDRLTETNEIGCIDFGLAVDAQDFDDAEIAKTLKFEEKVSGDDATVLAIFRLFPNDPAGMPARQIKWTLKKVGGDWKVSDIESAETGWKLSEFDCSGDAGAQ